MEELYLNNPEFKTYVDKYMETYRVSKDVALSHALVREYAEYLKSHHKPPL